MFKTIGCTKKVSVVITGVCVKNTLCIAHIKSEQCGICDLYCFYCLSFTLKVNLLLFFCLLLPTLVEVCFFRSYSDDHCWKIIGEVCIVGTDQQKI